jgi:hypothetical protein
MLFDDTPMARNVASITDIFTLYTSFFLIIDLLSFSLHGRLCEAICPAQAITTESKAQVDRS